MPSLTAAFCLSALFLVTSVRAADTPEKIQFNRDIRPILSENCFYCHGQDASHREAKLRLDERDDATRDRDGFFVIAPGKPEESELIARLLSKDPEEQMPPPNANKHVTPEQTALLRRWIAEGATYEKHWSFVAPDRAPLPGPVAQPSALNVRPVRGAPAVLRCSSRSRYSRLWCCCSSVSPATRKSKPPSPVIFKNKLKPGKTPSSPSTLPSLSSRSTPVLTPA